MDTTTAPPRNADTFIPQLQRSGGGVRGLARATRLSFPLYDEQRSGPRPRNRRMGGRKPSRVPRRFAAARQMTRVETGFILSLEGD